MHMHVGSISIFLMDLARTELKILPEAGDGVWGCERWFVQEKIGRSFGNILTPQKNLE